MLARFERSVIGQVILSVGVVFVLITIVVINMPDSHLRRDASKVTAPFADAVGLQQDWGIFSQPRTIAAYVDGGWISLTERPQPSGSPPAIG